MMDKHTLSRLYFCLIITSLIIYKNKWPAIQCINRPTNHAPPGQFVVIANMNFYWGLPYVLLMRRRRAVTTPAETSCLSILQWTIFRVLHHPFSSVICHLCAPMSAGGCTLCGWGNSHSASNSHHRHRHGTPHVRPPAALRRHTLWCKITNNNEN